MKKVLLAVSLLAFAGIASATGSSNDSHGSKGPSHGSSHGPQKPAPQQPVAQPTSQSRADSNSSAKSSADANSRSSSNASIGDTSSSSIANGGSASQGQGQEQSVDASGNATVSVDASSNYRRNPVNTAYAAPLTSSNDTCMGSSSAGAQGITFGLSFGTTWKDNDCVMRKDARFLHNIQRTEPALSLMCQKESVRRAIEQAGTRADRIACGLPVDVYDAELYDEGDWQEIESRDNVYRDGESG